MCDPAPYIGAMQSWLNLSFDPQPENSEANGADLPALDPVIADALARQLTAVLAMASRARPSGRSATVAWIEEHLGVSLDEATIVTAEWPTWRHASVQRAVEAFLRENAEWIGLAVPHPEHQGLADLLQQEAASGRRTLARPQLVEVATGPDTMTDALKLGLCRAHSEDGTPIVVCLRLSQEQGNPQAQVDLVLNDPGVGSAVLQRLRELADEHDVLRGQVVRFGASEHYGNHLVSFLPRPAVALEDVVLPDGVLESVTRHLSGIGRRAARLTELGVHLKRGVLLYGPPGTGKTHTARYLVGQALSATVIVLTGQGLSMIEPAAALARRLAPSIVVVEDVDLIAQDRDYSPTGNPLLFSLLDAMDGVAADADVTFLLTTNRTAELETALVQRPGRVDLAVEIPRPDAACRERLFGLYARGARLTADLTEAVARTEGVTASAIKELMRRAVLSAVEQGGSTVDGALLGECLTAFFADEARLTRALVGGATTGPAGPVASAALSGE